VRTARAPVVSACRVPGDDTGCRPSWVRRFGSSLPDAARSQAKLCRNRLALAMGDRGDHRRGAVGPWWTIGALSALAGVASLPPCCGCLRRRAWCVITAHRVRTGCAQACIRSASGKLPVVLATVSRPYGQRVLLWCRAGTCADDFAMARGMLASACWASDVRVFQDDRHAQLVTIDVIHTG
jgi:hypothetical protein